MTGYTKLFGSIIASTIWREPNATRIVWITMMAMADKNGKVEASIPGLADLARVTIAECETALKAFESPDPYSRSKDHQGRRIETIDGGWLLLNHAKYRAKMALEQRKEYHREYWHKRDTQQKLNNTQQYSTDSTQAEAEADTKAYTDQKQPARERVSDFESAKSRVGTLYGKERRWSQFEDAQLAEIVRAGRFVEEFDAIRNYRNSLQPADRTRFFPQSVAKLLEKWNELLDRGRVTGASQGDPEVAQLSREVKNL